jgi:hypothetical protein
LTTGREAELLIREKYGVVTRTRYIFLAGSYGRS